MPSGRNSQRGLSAAAVGRAMEASRRSGASSLGSPIHNGRKKTHSCDDGGDGAERCGDARPPAPAASFPLNLPVTDVG
jgi:hypothetical protein